MDKMLGTSLTESISGRGTQDALVSIADVGIDAVISSGAFDGVPLVGAATGLWRAGQEVRQQLFVRKISRFLAGLANTTQSQREDFTRKLDAEGNTEEFGETILLILDRIDDVKKPTLIGRIMAAHIRGEIKFDEAIRTVSIVSRCYSTDLNLLLNFKEGTQRENIPIAESLFAAGLLSTSGMSGGNMDDPLSGGIMYTLNDYGKILVEHGLSKA